MAATIYLHQPHHWKFLPLITPFLVCAELLTSLVNSSDTELFTVLNWFLRRFYTLSFMQQTKSFRKVVARKCLYWCRRGLYYWILLQWWSWEKLWKCAGVAWGFIEEVRCGSSIVATQEVTDTEIREHERSRLYGCQHDNVLSTHLPGLLYTWTSISQLSELIGRTGSVRESGRITISCLYWPPHCGPALTRACPVLNDICLSMEQPSLQGAIVSPEHLAK